MKKRARNSATHNDHDRDSRQPPTLQVGDVVRLRSGGPPMAVEAIHQASRPFATCIWTTARNETRRLNALFGVFELLATNEDRPNHTA